MKLIGLDVGTVRIGVAKADTSVKIATPVGTIDVDGNELNSIASIARRNNTTWFVVGLPRNNQGEETAQSQYARDFAKKLAQAVPGAKIRFQDESLTSVEAENRLKSRKKGFKKGDIDAEAATIILQDFIESFSPSTGIENEASAESSSDNNNPKKGKKTMKKLTRIFILAVLAIGVAGFCAYSWYNSNLDPVIKNVDCETNPDRDDCAEITFTIESGETTAIIAENLESAGLIRKALAFQIYYYFHYGNTSTDSSLKAGEYQMPRTLSVPEIIEHMIAGDSTSNVFSLMITPGETVSDIKEKLVEQYSYSEEEVDAAFAKDYDHPALAGKGDTSAYGAEPLEGYMFGDTYEFYKGESVENIITTVLDKFYEVIKGNNLESRFADHGLTLYQGITLASIVQKEASSEDQPTVAQVFYKRLEEGMSLGSDVTLQYALDLVDPDRTTYTDNSSALGLDSLYNTRKYTGLTPGPICNPGVSALLAVADPSDTDYLYFLTGDDGKMYYSSTDSGHQQNIIEHCQELCSTSL